MSAFLEMWLQSSAASSWDRAIEVKANRTVNLRLNFLRGSFSIGSKADKCLRTGPTDQVEQELGVVRLNWKIPSWIVTQQVGYPAVAQLLDHVIGNYRLCILKMSCTPNWVSWIVQLRKQTHHLQVLKRDIYSVKSPASPQLPGSFISRLSACPPRCQQDFSHLWWKACCL